MAKHPTMIFPLTGPRRPFYQVVVFLLVVLLFSAGASCSKKRSPAAPNIIMIVVDTLRADHLSTYGYARNTDPNIADFAKHAVVFQRAIAPAPWTMPSYASILEGKLAFNHNMNDYHAATPDGVLLTSYLRSASYRTATIQTNLLMQFIKSGDYFDETFFYMNDNSDDEPGGVFQDQSAADRFAKWINENASGQSPFYFLIGMMSPHWEYETDNGFLREFIGDALYKSTGPLSFDILSAHPDGSGCWTYDMIPLDLQVLMNGEPVSSTTSTSYYNDGRLYIAGYDSEIKLADLQIGKMLAKLKDAGLYEDSIIIITADHGENMMDHEHYFGHSDNLYQSLLHVPLLIKFPHQSDQKIVTEYVRTIDILPTAFDYSGINYTGTDGKSLLPIIAGEDVDYDERPVISYRVDDTGLQAVSLIRDSYKLIRNRGTEQVRLYNLQSDPHEAMDLSAVEPDKVAQLKDYLKRFFQLW